MFSVHTVTAQHTGWHEAMAALLHAVFPVNWPGSWETMEEAREEIAMLLAPEHLCLAALDEQGAVIGFIGGLPEYDGNVWELHPLVVAPAWQGRGVGRALVQALEEQARARGGLTLMLGTDDVTHMTSLYGADLYTDTFAQLESIRNLRRHPYEFYLKLGFRIVGVMPDANGIGKPDLYMAKRLCAAR